MRKNLYLNSYSDILRRDANTLKIGNKKIPISMIDNVYVISNAKLSVGALKLLLKNGRSVFYLNTKYELIGILTPDRYDSDYKKRLKQYKNAKNLAFAGFIVLKKIETIEKILQKNLNRYKEKLKDVKSLNEILGIEGSVSSLFFREFKENLEKREIFEFKKREYRPVKDRINGVLSFLYTLYYNYLYSEVIANGLDPYVGFLHIKRGRHAVFVSDMMEEARVELTWLLFDFIDEIYPDRFEGLFLDKKGRKIVLKFFDEFVYRYENTLLKKTKEMLC